MKARRRDCLAVHRFLAAALRGERPWDAAHESALQAPIEVWALVTGYERCGAQVYDAITAAAAPKNGSARHSAIRANAGIQRIPGAVRALLRAQSEQALHQALACMARLQQIAAIAHEAQIPVMALKGSARLLLGERPGVRTIADVDLLVTPGQAPLLHALLRKRLNLGTSSGVGTHHLPPLVGPGAPAIEVHHEVSSRECALEALMWHEPRTVETGNGSLLAPSPTAHLLHTLHHAAVGHWTARHRLRGVTDVATAWRADVSGERVLEYVRASPQREALEALLSAAHDLDPRVPLLRRDAWQFIERAAAGSFAAAGLPVNGVAGVQLMNWGAVLRGSGARELAAHSRRVLRRLISAGAAAIMVLAGCSSNATGPTPPSAVEPPAFVYVSNETGVDRLHVWENGASRLLEASAAGDAQPHSAAGKLVFSSLRHGNAEVYISELDATLPVRLTQVAGADLEPALDPTGMRVAFASARSGVMRIWVMNADGSGQQALATGSDGIVAERSPRWSPDGSRIAFTSVRSGSSQVYVVAADGGEAQRVTLEPGGAFEPSWSESGESIYYVEASSTPRVRRVALASGDVVTVASAAAADVGHAACNATGCLAVLGAYSATGNIAFFPGTGGSAVVLIEGAGHQRNPAILVD